MEVSITNDKQMKKKYILHKNLLTTVLSAEYGLVTVTTGSS